jgi:rhodanese-related sulfurtransferase
MKAARPRVVGTGTLILSCQVGQLYHYHTKCIMTDLAGIYVLTACEPAVSLSVAKPLDTARRCTMTATSIIENGRPKVDVSVRKVSAEALYAALADGGELALLDVRDNFGHARDGHILLSVSAPFNQLEVQITALVPRRQTPVVVYDGGDAVLAEASAARLVGSGYTDVAILEGGTKAWRAAGYELFTGVHVIGKAFGEYVEHRYETPHISARDLKPRLDAGENIAILDSRPEVEFRAFSIPKAINLPGAELVYRLQEAVPDPDTLVVVNCAGRTRSIIGAQALINAGVPNRVVSLANGTMDWLIEGLPLDSGKTNPAPPPGGPALEQAREAAQRLHARFGIQQIDRDTLAKFQEDAQSGSRSLYLLDVRSPEEYAAGHIYGSRSAPGGQLVQQIGQWVGTRNARLVLIDDADGVRAAITASWLVQINWGDVYVLEDALSESRVPGVDVAPPSVPIPHVSSVNPGALNDRMRTGGATVIDLDTSLVYEAGHIPGAYFAIRSRLEADLDAVPGNGWIVLTSSDGVLAAFAATDLAKQGARPVYALSGGTVAWRAAGLALETGAGQRIHPFEDVARSAYQTGGDRFAAFREYLAWEIGLVAQLRRDGTANFRLFPEDP